MAYIYLNLALHNQFMLFINGMGYLSLRFRDINVLIKYIECGIALSLMKKK